METTVTMSLAEFNKLKSFEEKYNTLDKSVSGLITYVKHVGRNKSFEKPVHHLKLLVDKYNESNPDYQFILKD